MTAETTSRTAAARPLNVVLRPRSEAAAAFQAEALAPGFEPEPELALRYLGGRTLPDLAYSLVYLEGWDAAERASLDGALEAAMTDPVLNDVLAQYFPDAPVTARFAGSRLDDGAAQARVDKAVVEGLVGRLEPDGSVVCVLLPRGTVLDEGSVDSEQGLAGFHGSIHAGPATVYYAVSVYSEGSNGIVAFDEPWKNVCATLYHELQEVRTDPDVEDAIRAGGSPAAQHFLGWYSPAGGEIGDIPVTETHGDIGLVMREVPLAAGGTAPVQLMWSNRVGGPEGPAES